MSTSLPDGVISAVPGASTGPVTTKNPFSQIFRVFHLIWNWANMSPGHFYPRCRMHAKKAVWRFTGPLKLVAIFYTSSLESINEKPIIWFSKLALIEKPL